MLAVYLTTLAVSRLYNVGDRMINEYGAVCGMRIGRGNRSIRRKLVQIPLCSPQIPRLELGSNLGCCIVGSL
jgi:hypothetical protein